MKRLSLKRSILCLILGVMTTVGIAWGCGALSSLVASEESKLLRTHEDTPCWVIYKFSSHSGSFVSAIEVQTDSIARYLLIPDSTYTPDIAAFVPYWSQLTNSIKADDTKIPRYIQEIARGWPMRALSCETEVGWDWDAIIGPKIIRHGIIIGKFPNSGSLSDRIFPLKPIWLGFVIDTALYWLLWYVVLSTLLWMYLMRRTRKRRRRGLCIHCAYDLRGSNVSGQCPECGMQIADRYVAQ